MNLIMNDLLRNFRKATVLIAAENCGLRETLLHGYNVPTVPCNTEDRIVSGAVALGMCEGAPARWKDALRDLAVDESEWNRTLAVIHHQQTYLDLVSGMGRGREMTNPKQQLASNPGEYSAFLRGVEASHIHHAEWFSQLPEFAKTNRLVDLGGGLGTFSRSWVVNKAGRHATLVDLPGVAQLLCTEELSKMPITFVGIDLNRIEALPEGEIYLLANVLHLLPDWQGVLQKVVQKAAVSSTIVVMEADPQGVAGTLFDLQVHLRSGGIGGLLQPEAINSVFKSCGLTNLHSVATSDPTDPFDRKYYAWFGQKLENTSPVNGFVTE